MNKELKIAVHYEENIREDNYCHRWIIYLKERGVNVYLTNFKEANIIERLRDCDGVMWHWSHTVNDKQCAPKILQAIEEGLKIPVFPNLESRWHYDEKVAQHYLLEAINAPKIKSWVFWDYKEAAEFFERAEYPLVYKLSVGAGSSHVFKINSKKEAKKYLKINFKKGVFPYYRYDGKITFLKKQVRKAQRFGRSLLGGLEYILTGKFPKLPNYFKAEKNYIYVQEFIPNNDYDIRVAVVGPRAFAFIRYNRPGDFRASGSGLIENDPDKIPIESIRIAHKISKENKFQSMAYDFLIDSKNQLVLGELSYCYVSAAIGGAEGYVNCPGYWDRSLKWHEGNMWPERAHVEDFIYYIKNKRLP